MSGMSNALAQNFSPATMNDGSSMHMGSVMSNSYPPQPSTSVGGTESTVGDPSTPVVIKRRPGRPKGSGKKALIAGDSSDPATPKIKRPVGRPRKDGLPSGSVGPRRPSRPRKSAPAKLGANGPEVPFTGVRTYTSHVNLKSTKVTIRVTSLCPQRYNRIHNGRRYFLRRQDLRPGMHLSPILQWDLFLNRRLLVAQTPSSAHTPSIQTLTVEIGWISRVPNRTSS